MFQTFKPLTDNLGTGTYEGPGADYSHESLQSRFNSLNENLGRLSNVLTACGPLLHDTDGGTIEFFANNQTLNEHYDTDQSVFEVNNYQYDHNINENSYAATFDGGVHFGPNWNAVFQNWMVTYMRANVNYYAVVTYQTGSTVCGTMTGCSTLVVDFSGATSLKIPTSAAPTVSANGHIGIDTTMTDWANGNIVYFSTASMGVVAMPIAQFTAPTNGFVPTYNSTTDLFELASPTAATTVTSVSVIADDAVVVGAGGARGVEGSPVSISSAGVMTGIVGLTASAGGTFNFGSATALTVPNADVPVLSGAGQIALDTLVTDFDNDVLLFHNGTATQGVVSMGITQFTTPTDGFVPKYNATSNAFELATPTASNVNTAAGAIGDNKLMRGDGGDRGTQQTGITIDDSDNVTGVASLTATSVTVGASTPFSDAAGTLTLQNVDALDATTEATIEAALDTLANVTSIQGNSFTNSGASTINQDVSTGGTPAFVGAALTTGFLKLGTTSELTIATGAVTATRSTHTVDTEADAASDDLDTISGTAAGRRLIISPADGARTVVVKHGTGNIFLRGNADITLDDIHDTCWLFCVDGTNWYGI